MIKTQKIVYYFIVQDDINCGYVNLTNSLLYYFLIVDLQCSCGTRETQIL